MYELRSTTVAGHAVRVVATERSDGDMNPRRVPPDRLAARQRQVTGATWAMLEQVHGAAVVHTSTDGHDATRAVGDIAIADAGAPAVAVWAADCGPLALIGADASVAVVHAGWRGLAAGVVDTGVAALTRGSTAAVAVVDAVLGPVIHPCCYEFSSDDIHAVADGVGAAPDRITGRTAAGAVALDIPAAIGAALGRAGVSLSHIGPCTGCDTRWYSHRVRHETARHAVVAWSAAA